MHDISPYSVRIRENMDQKNSEYEHFSRSVVQIDFIFIDIHLLPNSCCKLMKVLFLSYFLFVKVKFWAFGFPY